MKTVILYSIGHSNRTAAELIGLLRAAGLATLMDVRAQPASARHPQFAMEALRAALGPEGIVYHWAGRQLGGLRQPRPDSPHIALESGGFRGFADYMESEAFQRGMSQLVNLGMKAPTAFLCAEKLPESCHRSLIADYLTLQGITVLHLIDADKTREHRLNPLARTESGKLVYDRQASRPLPLH
jgi:uncharacterized protein (DUF488 family)